MQSAGSLTQAVWNSTSINVGTAFAESDAALSLEGADCHSLFANFLLKLFTVHPHTVLEFAKS
jgi:hypothetical protein